MGSVTSGGRFTVTMRRFPAIDGSGSKRLESDKGLINSCDSLLIFSEKNTN